MEQGAGPVVPGDELLTGQALADRDSLSDEPQPVAPYEEPAPDFDQNFTLLPRYEVNLSAAPGLVPAHVAVEESPFFRDMAAPQSDQRRPGGSCPGAWRRHGTNVPDGAPVLVDAAEARVDREDIHAFGREGEACITRLGSGSNTLERSPHCAIHVSEIVRPAALCKPTRAAHHQARSCL